MNPLVSILIPCYNAERYVGEALESALGQTYPNVEVIVVDDGSTDGSLDVLKSFEHRIRWQSGPNRGACSARNHAFALSRGEFIQFFDADDVLAPTKIERQMEPLLADNADIVLCWSGVIPATGPPRPPKRPWPQPLGDPFLYFAKNVIQTNAPLHRRSWIERVGGFREELGRGQEYDLHLRLASMTPRVRLIEEVLVWVRMHQGERITNRPMSHEGALNILLGVAAAVDHVGQHGAGRCEWLADRIVSASRACFAEGNRKLANDGFAAASKLDPTVGNRANLPRRVLGRFLTPYGVESVLQGLRPIARLCGRRSERVTSLQGRSS